MKICKKVHIAVSAVLIFMLTFGSFGYAAVYDFSDELFSLSINASAGVFFETEQPKFRVRLENPYRKEISLLLNSSVYDINNSVVWNKSKNVTLKSKETLMTSIAVDGAIPYGNYNFKLEVTDENSNTFTKNAEFAFSVENSEQNEWLSTTFHLGDNPEYEDVLKNTELASKAGFSRNRDDIRWSICEKTAGNPQLPEWQEQIFNEERKGGQKSPILILNAQNYIYTRNLFPHAYDETVCAEHPYCAGNNYTLKQQIAAYGRFCAAVAKKFKGTKPIFEIGNEPDILRTYKSRNPSQYVNVSGADYAEMLKTAYKAIKEVDSDATVISAGLCAFANDNTIGFAEELLAVDGITKYMDGFSFHPYTYTVGYGDELSKSNAAFFTQLDDAKVLLNEAAERDGTSGIKLWLTEFGSKSENEREQAAADVRTAVMSRAEPMVEMANLYNFVSKGTNLSEGENRYGIIRKNYTSVKPAYIAVSHMNKRLAGAEFKDGLYERAYSGTRNFSAYGFKKETEFTKQYTYVIWEHTGKNAELTIKRGDSGSETVMTDSSQPVITVASDAEVKVYDMAGNEITSSGSYQLSSEPVYVVSTIKSGEKTRITKNGNIISVSGIAKTAQTDVTLLAVKENSLIPSYVSVQQSKSNSLSEYSFKLALQNTNDRYSVYVFDGEQKELVGRCALYTDIKLQYLINGSMADNLENAKSGDDIKVKLTLNRTENGLPNLKFYGVVDGGTAVSVSSEQIVWNGSEGETIVDLKNLPNTDMAKLFLWDEMLKPITPFYEMR